MENSLNIITIILISFGLAMDAFAVSIINGISINQKKIKMAVLIALFFGGFQAVMPVIGWLAGTGLKDYISSFNHWIAFALLCYIGIKMIYDAVKISHCDDECKPLSLSTLVILSIATSIDALAIGVTFSILNISIIFPVIIIGIITFLLSFIGVFIGNKFGCIFGNKIEIAGGVILILIGIKILLENLLSSSV